MLPFILSLFLLAFAFQGHAQDNQGQILNQDLAAVFATAKIHRQVTASFVPSVQDNEVHVRCEAGHKINLQVTATEEEKIPTLYYALYKMGFYFPHPRVQISPKVSAVNAACGKTWTWTPSMKVRGFHLHTQHPNEWVSGFMEGQPQIAREYLHWLAHNFQNLFQIQVLRTSEKQLIKTLHELDPLRKALGLRLALSVSFASIQQNAKQLISPWKIFFRGLSLADLNESLEQVAKDYDFDFLTVELGTSEFTPTPARQTLEWIEVTRKFLKPLGKRIYLKLHVSSNQQSDDYGNYNLLPLKTNHEVGILPHTVMFYGLQDKYFPMYGRTSIDDFRDIVINESKKRPTIYYPETSYFIAMDIDVPIFLTDYLVARAQDLKLLAGTAAEGVLTFSSGQELGYWLFDWTTALQAAKENLGDPKIGLRLLGEDMKTWDQILKFQTEYFKGKQVIQLISSTNFQDELPFAGLIHKRNVLMRMSPKSAELGRETKLLDDTILHLPDLSNVKSHELKLLLEITQLRVRHARALREAFLQQKPMESAVKLREKAQTLVDQFVLGYSRYPDSFVFVARENVTSYPFGYGYAAKTLHFWKREEEIVKQRPWTPFFMNIWDIWDILL